MIAFEHNGTSYEISAMTEFQADMRNSYLVQVGKLIKEQLNLAELNDIPSSLDRLGTYFVDWHLCTRIDGKRMNLVSFSDKEALFEFFDLIGSDDELANKWLKAYRQANRSEDDEKNVVAPVSA